MPDKAGMLSKKDVGLSVHFERLFVRYYFKWFALSFLLASGNAWSCLKTKSLEKYRDTSFLRQYDKVKNSLINNDKLK